MAKLDVALGYDQGFYDGYRKYVNPTNNGNTDYWKGWEAGQLSKAKGEVAPKKGVYGVKTDTKVDLDLMPAETLEMASEAPKIEFLDDGKTSPPNNTGMFVGIAAAILLLLIVLIRR